MSVLTEWYRRLYFHWRTPPGWILRPGTIDRRIFRTVVLENEYELPERFDAQDVIVDVGAHIGWFAYAALRRQAGQVYCYEADPDNFHVLQRNLRRFARRVQAVHAAVWRSDEPVDRLGLRNPCDPRNTGAGRVEDGATGPTVPACRFDDLVTEIVTRHGRPVRLVKLDCEGAEWPILLTSRQLGQVETLCGEYHLGGLPDAYAVAGFPALTPQVLVDFLTSRGFSVRIESNRAHPQFGLFFATAKERSPLAFP